LLVLTSVTCACIVRPRRDMRKCDEMRGYVRQRRYTPYCVQCGHVHGKSDFTLRLHARATNGEINIGPAFVRHRYFESPTYLSRELMLEINVIGKVSNNNYGKIKFVKVSKI